jgi:hypothetical protein
MGSVTAKGYNTRAAIATAAVRLLLRSIMEGCRRLV